MVNHLTSLGIFHTIISVLALLAGLVGLARDGKIDSKNWMGKFYLWGTAITCLTAFGIMKTGHFTPGHTLALVILILLVVGVAAPSMRFLGGLSVYVQTVALSATVFLSLIPTTIETLTRLPVNQPIASSPDAEIVKRVLIGWTVCFGVGMIYQLTKLRKKSPHLS